MENIMDSYVSSKSSSYATGPLLASISKGPQNLGANFLHLPKLNEILIALLLSKHGHLSDNIYLFFSYPRTSNGFLVLL